MKSIGNIGLAFIALSMILQASLVSSQHKKVECAGHDISLSEQEVEAMNKCFKKIGINAMEELKEDHLPCLAKCIMENEGLLDAEGRPHKENILRDIETAVPENMRDKYKASIEKCIDLHDKELSPEDEMCTSYRPFIMCVLQAVNDVNANQPPLYKVI